MPIRVLVVDDSILFRARLQVSLGADKELEVVGCAMDALQAMDMIEKFSPDVVTLDVEMPKINGIAFLKQLIPQRPIPVVVVSGLPINVLDALDVGAVDFVRKPPAGPDALKLFIDELIEKIKIASKAKVRRLPSTEASLVSRLSSSNISVSRNTMIAIGASTGGTEAIIEVVKNLPLSTPGILIVQHMPANFTNLYAQRLSKICKMNAKEATDFDRLVPGQILLAAGDYHLTLKKDATGYFIRSQPGPKVSGHCPSVDVMFDSVAQIAGKDAVGVLLTGMGADGARGITKMRQAGAYTIGQDKDSCVVYGMPMEAFKMGGITKQFPLDQIGDELIYYLNKLSKQNR